MYHQIKCLMAFAILCLLASCTNNATHTNTPAQTVENKPEPASFVPSTETAWQTIEGGGETTCSDGSDYKFFYRAGDPQKLMVYLQGGGGCWTRETCDPQMNPTYTRNIPEDFEPRPFGIFNYTNQNNPFADYTVVFAPYCTGDVHLGAKDTVYPPVNEDQAPLTIHHQGRTNMQAVLDWTYASVESPKQVFVTGSSAGAIPSPFYASLIADHYTQAQVAQLGDGAGGYRRMNADTRPDSQWGTFDYIQSERGFEDLTPETFNYEKLYIAAAKAHPEILFAEYDAAQDSVQKRFLALSGNKNVDLLAALQANHADIRAEATNFRAFITGGETHTALGQPFFYTFGVNGTSLRDWVTELAQYKPVDDVTCEPCSQDTYAGEPLTGAMLKLWQTWEDPAQQYVEPFQIFDNLYYVGIDWVAAYVLQTSDGLVLIDSLYGRWVRPLLANMRKLGLDPADIKYVINTHGHFDHAGGSAFLQYQYGATVVMAQEDWDLAGTQPDIAQFYMPVPSLENGIIAKDGDVLVLGDTKIEMFKTPGHTEGVLSLRYPVKDGAQTHTAITLGGVGLNFSGVERTEQYLNSYARLQKLAEGVAVSLPNHAAMGKVFERRDQLAQRQTGQPHPFVNAEGFQADLKQFIQNAETKLAAEQRGETTDPAAVLTRTLKN